MENETPTTETTSATDRHQARLPAVVHLALDVADRGQSTAISVLNDARAELRSALDHGLELAEQLTTGAFRFARKLTQRLDEVSAEALSGAEKALTNAVKTARETTRVAEDRVAKGRKPDHGSAPQAQA